MSSTCRRFTEVVLQLFQGSKNTENRSTVLNACVKQIACSKAVARLHGQKALEGEKERRAAGGSDIPQNSYGDDYHRECRDSPACLHSECMSIACLIDACQMPGMTSACWVSNMVLGACEVHDDYEHAHVKLCHRRET